MTTTTREARTRQVRTFGDAVIARVTIGTVQPVESTVTGAIDDLDESTELDF